MSEKMRVGILMGGPSSEREVSLESGRHYHSNLNPDKYEAIAIYVDRQKKLWEIPLPLLVQNTTDDIEDRLEEATHIPYDELKQRIDFALLGLHGKFMEDGCMQGLLELLGIPYSGSGVLGSAIGMNKYVQRQLLESAGLDVPKTIAITEENWKENKDKLEGMVKENLGFPCIVKPIQEGCSTGVTKVNSIEELEAAVNETFKWDDTALVEGFINGLEFTTTVIGNESPRALIPTEVPPSNPDDVLSLEDKFLPGGAQMITPARMSEEKIAKVQEAMVKAYKALDARVYSRIDGFLADGKVYILEINTLPGATPSTCIYQQAAHEGWTPMDFIDQIINLSMEVHQGKVGPA